MPFLSGLVQFFSTRSSVSLPRSLSPQVQGAGGRKSPYETRTLGRPQPSSGQSSSPGVPRPVPRVPVSAEEAQAKQEEKDAADGYLTFTCEGRLPDNAPYADDQIYDDVDDHIHAEEGPLDADGEQIYVAGNVHEQHGEFDDIYDDLEYTEDQLAAMGEDEIDPYSQYSLSLPTETGADIDPYARCSRQQPPSNRRATGSGDSSHYKSPRPLASCGTDAGAAGEDEEGTYEDDYSVPDHYMGHVLPSGDQASPLAQRDGRRGSGVGSGQENAYDHTLRMPSLDTDAPQPKHYQTPRVPAQDISNPPDAYDHALPANYIRQTLGAEKGEDEDCDLDAGAYDDVNAEDMYMNVSQIQTVVTGPGLGPQPGSKKQPRAAPRVQKRSTDPNSSPPPLPGEEPGEQNLGSGPPPLPGEDESDGGLRNRTGNTPPPLPGEEPNSQGTIPPPLPGEEEDDQQDQRRRVSSQPPPLPPDDGEPSGHAVGHTQPTLTSSAPKRRHSVTGSPPPLPPDTSGPPPLPPDDNEPLPPPPLPDEEDQTHRIKSNPSNNSVRLPKVQGARARAATSPVSPPPLPGEELHNEPETAPQSIAQRMAKLRIAHGRAKEGKEGIAGTGIPLCAPADTGNRPARASSMSSGSPPPLPPDNSSLPSHSSHSRSGSLTEPMLASATTRRGAAPPLPGESGPAIAPKPSAKGPATLPRRR